MWPRNAYVGKSCGNEGNILLLQQPKMIIVKYMHLCLLSPQVLSFQLHVAYYFLSMLSTDLMFWTLAYILAHGCSVLNQKHLKVQLVELMGPSYEKTNLVSTSSILNFALVPSFFFMNYSEMFTLMKW